MFWAFVISIVLVVIVMASGNEKAKEAARLAYLEALEKLKKNPSSSDLRQQALATGRSYANLVRDNKGNTTFDEVALMNDINAACANAHAQPDMARIEASVSIEERLTKLQSLRDTGLISDDDHQTRKREILGQI